MKICSECKNKMFEKIGETPEGIEYKYYKCTNCNEEILDMKQLHNVAERYKKIEERMKKGTCFKRFSQKDAIRHIKIL